MSNIVSCNGCFDGLHPGHMFLLGFVAGQMQPCDQLIVFINSDAYIKRNKREPHYTAAARIQHLLATGVVDDVVVFDEMDAVRCIKEYRPRVHCVSKAYADGCPEIVACKAQGTRVAIIPTVGDWSSTALKGRTVYDEACV